MERGILKRAILLWTAAALWLVFVSAAGAQNPPAAHAVPDGISVYTNPRYAWSIAYPANWGLDAADAGFVRITAPEKNGVCGIHSGPVKFATAQALTDSMLAFAAKNIKQSKGLQQITVSREDKMLRTGVAAEEVVVRMNPNGGAARRIYAVSNGNGFLVDCAASDAAWASNDVQFKKIVGSFTLSR